MCGIVGYVGRRDCKDVLLDGLSKLEYRGYDSAGVALARKDGIRVIKAKGRLAVLREKLAGEALPPCSCGIGHTRWATHGEPSDVNSHPQSTPRVSLVHNGIIENYGALKTALDAPVSGGDVGAQKGTLAIMVGGDRAVFDRMQPVFAAMGTNIRYQGAAGNGQHTKMANQIAISGCIAAVCEAIAYAKKCGLDPQDMFDAISTGAAGSWQMTNNGQKIIDGNFAPGFYVKHFIKDMNIAIDESDAREMGLDVLHLVRDKYVKLAELGGGDDGTQALIKVVEK